jgi:hypothetical protein
VGVCVCVCLNECVYIDTYMYMYILPSYARRLKPSTCEERGEGLCANSQKSVL